MALSLALNPRAAQSPSPPPVHPALSLFETSDRCMACHNGLTAASGEDVSIGSNWRASMMANAARDPYWQAAVRREVIDHPEAPGGRSRTSARPATCPWRGSRRRHQVAVGRCSRTCLWVIEATRIDQLAADGVSCAICHQIADDRLGTPESFTGGFVVDTSLGAGERPAFGPFDVDRGRTRIMQSATGFEPTEAAHIQSSEMCATCHTLYTHALNTEGDEIAELAEQVPYLEWRHSGYADDESCQSCHMPVVEDRTPIANVLGEPRDGFSRHVFRGGNFFMLQMLNRYRAELGVVALPQELEAAAQRTVAHLQTEAATIAIRQFSRSAGRLRFSIAVENLAGHKLPTAYPSRRVWLHVRVRDGDDETVFESGVFKADGSIRGNDNDDDADRFEPHYAEITTPDQVQIYEPIMVGENDVVTTGLLTGVRYVKDNRLLPRGFDSATAAWEVAVAGGCVGGLRFHRRRRPGPLCCRCLEWDRTVSDRGGTLVSADRVSLGTEPRRLRRGRAQALREVLRHHVGIVGDRAHDGGGEPVRWKPTRFRWTPWSSARVRRSGCHTRRG